MHVICDTQFISIISLVDLPDIGRTFLLLWNKFHCSGINLLRTNVIILCLVSTRGSQSFSSELLGQKWIFISFNSSHLVVAKYHCRKRILAYDK